jgi:hypothetical protein
LAGFFAGDPYPQRFSRFVLLLCCRREGSHMGQNSHLETALYLDISMAYGDILEIHMSGIKMAMTRLLSDVSSRLVVILEAGP